jgi:hypothetical protein
MGVEHRIRHVREFSQQALDHVDGEVDLLYIDGPHGYGPLGPTSCGGTAACAPEGFMLIRDSYSAVGQTMALMTSIVFGAEFRYVGRSQSMAEYRREPVHGIGRVRNAIRELGELG